jgi:hypothetical protein
MPPQTIPRISGAPRPVNEPSSDGASAKAMLMPAAFEGAFDVVAPDRRKNCAEPLLIDFEQSATMLVLFMGHLGE